MLLSYWFKATTAVSRGRMGPFPIANTSTIKINHKVFECSRILFLALTYAIYGHYLKRLK
jgi:hypothetical protein